MSSPTNSTLLVYVITKQKVITNEEYFFSSREDFFKKINSKYSVIEHAKEYLDIHLDEGLYASLFYASEFDTNNTIVSGNLIIEVHSSRENDLDMIDHQMNELANLLLGKAIQIDN